MQIPKGMVVERIRAGGDPDRTARADAELPEKVDTERDADLLRSFDLDPQELAAAGRSGPGHRMIAHPFGQVRATGICGTIARRHRACGVAHARWSEPG